MLFEPFYFSGLQLKNRIVRAATYEKRADEDGFVTDSLIELYKDLAMGGSGLIITGNALVHPLGRSLPRMLCIHSDIYIPGLKKITKAVHQREGLIVLQLSHGGRQCPPLLLGVEHPLAPSEVYEPSLKVTPRAMTDTEIWEIVDAFAAAAERAQSAGFDAVELHGAHGYLISSFLSPYTNRRDDYWGGDEERRFHFIEEVCKAVRKAVGSEYPVLVKINSDDLLPGGIKPDESVRVAMRLESMGMDAVEISGGVMESPVKPVRPNILKVQDEAYLRDAGRLFKQRLRIPVILTGGMRSKSVMEDVLRSKEADLVGISRPLIREPDLPHLMRQGKEKADCISCNKCVRFSRLSRIRCRQIKEEG